MIIDSHCHLDPSYFPEGADAVLERARAAGVDAFVVIGVGPDLARPASPSELAARRPDVHAAIGVHPHDAAARRRGRARRDRGRSPRAPRSSPSARSASTTTTCTPRRTPSRASSATSSALARSLGKPIVIHTREAPEDTLAILEHGGRGRGGRHHPLLLRGPPVRRARARARLRPVVLGHRHLQERPRRSRRSPPGPRATGSWSRPTAPTSPDPVPRKALRARARPPHRPLRRRAPRRAVRGARAPHRREHAARALRLPAA